MVSGMQILKGMIAFTGLAWLVSGIALVGIYHFGISGWSPGPMPYYQIYVVIAIGLSITAFLLLVFMQPSEALPLYRTATAYFALFALYLAINYALASWPPLSDMVFFAFLALGPAAGLIVGLANRPSVIQADKRVREAGDDPDKLRSVARDLTKNGEYSVALRIWDRLCKLRPHDPENWFNLGECQGATAQPQEAVGSYREAIAKGYSDPAEAYFEMGVMYSQTATKPGNPRWEHECYMKALASNPFPAREADILTNLGLLFDNEGKRLYEDMRQRSRVRRMSPMVPWDQGFPTVMTRIDVDWGSIRDARQAFETSRACYEEALRINPNHTQAQINLEILLQHLATLREWETGEVFDRV